MIRLITFLLILLLSFTSFSFAQHNLQENGEYGVKGNTIKMKKMIKSYTMVQLFLFNASTLDLTDSQRQELYKVKKNYLYPMIQKEVEYQVSEMKVMDMLKEPNFNPANVKRAIEYSINLTRENAILSVDALTEIRKAVGVDNFNKLREMMNLIPNKNIKSDDKKEKEKYPSSEQRRSL